MREFLFGKKGGGYLGHLEFVRRFRCRSGVSLGMATIGY
jgi:hypothetical protein